LGLKSFGARSLLVAAGVLGIAGVLELVVGDGSQGWMLILGCGIALVCAGMLRSRFTLIHFTVFIISGYLALAGVGLAFYAGHMFGPGLLTRAAVLVAAPIFAVASVAVAYERLVKTDR
jgi:hypothetical protein